QKNPNRQSATKTKKIGKMDSMTDDLWAMVLARLPIKIFTGFKLVCKQWKSIVESPFFRDLFIFVHQISPSSSWSLMCSYCITSEMVGHYQCDTWGLKRSLGSFIDSFLSDKYQKSIHGRVRVRAYSDVGLILIHINWEWGLVTRTENGYLLGYKIVLFDNKWGDSKLRYPISLNGNLHWLSQNKDHQEVVLSMDTYATSTVDGRKLCLWRLQSEGWQLISEISPDFTLTGLDYLPLMINPLDVKTAYFWSPEKEKLLYINLHNGKFVIHNRLEGRSNGPIMIPVNDPKAMISLSSEIERTYIIERKQFVPFVLPQWLYRIPNNCNTTSMSNAAWRGDLKLAGLGWTIEDKDQQTSKLAHCHFVGSPLVAEGLALREALSFSISAGIRRLQVFSDSIQKKRKMESLTDDLWTMVLARLPIKIFTCFKLVCKQWKSILESPFFRNLFMSVHQNSPSSSWSLMYYSMTADMVADYECDTWGLNRPLNSFIKSLLFDKYDKHKNRHFNVVAYSDAGLILIHTESTDIEKGVLYLANPVSRECVEIFLDPRPIGIEMNKYCWEWGLVTRTEHGHLLGYKKTTKFKRTCTPCQGFLMYMNITKLDGSLEDKLCVWRLRSEGWQLISKTSPGSILTGFDYLPITIDPFDAKTAYFWSTEQESLLYINLHNGKFVIHNQFEHTSDGHIMISLNDPRAMVSVKSPIIINHIIKQAYFLPFVLPQWLYRIP
ncbi:hypothetical protein HID58_084352, partial [Brassica napus]